MDLIHIANYSARSLRIRTVHADLQTAFPLKVVRIRVSMRLLQNSKRVRQKLVGPRQVCREPFFLWIKIDWIRSDDPKAMKRSKRIAFISPLVIVCAVSWWIEIRPLFA